MPVYSVSVRELAYIRERCKNSKSSSSASAGRNVDNIPEAAGLTQKFESVSPPTRPKSAETHASIEELLRLSEPELEEFFTEWSMPASKVLFALIYRLASHEAQLTRLSSGTHSKNVTSPDVIRDKRTYKEGDTTSKVDVLEQVFRKNLSLRAMD